MGKLGFVLLPLGGQLGLGFEENFEDGLPLGGGEAGEFAGCVAAGEDLMESVVEIQFDREGECIPLVGVDEIAEGIAEDAGVEVEVAEGAAVVVAWTEGGELLGEGGRTGDAVEESLVLEG